MYEPLEVTIEGTCPTLQHNGQMADPLNEWAKKLKAVSGKRKKTDEDHEEMSRIEFFGSLYLDKDLRVCWPSENIESMLNAAARKRKEGPQARTGMMVTGDFPLTYTGPETAEELWQHGGFILRCACGVNGSRVMRTRPLFRDWSLRFTVMHDPKIVNADIVLQWCDIAGREVGLSDWRPKFGRFQVVK